MGSFFGNKPKGIKEISKKAGITTGIIFVMSVLIWFISGYLLFFLGLPGFFFFNPFFDLGDLMIYKLIVLAICSASAGISFVVLSSGIKRRIILTGIFFILTFCLILLVLWILFITDVLYLIVIYIV